MVPSIAGALLLILLMCFWSSCLNLCQATWPGSHAENFMDGMHVVTSVVKLTHFRKRTSYQQPNITGQSDGLVLLCFFSFLEGFSQSLDFNNLDLWYNLKTELCVNWICMWLILKTGENYRVANTLRENKANFWLFECFFYNSNANKFSQSNAKWWALGWTLEASQTKGAYSCSLWEPWAQIFPSWAYRWEQNWIFYQYIYYWYIWR